MLNNLARANIRSKQFSVIERLENCYRCEEQTPVVAIYLKAEATAKPCTNYTAELDPSVARWKTCEVDCFPNMITQLPEVLAISMAERTMGRFRFVPILAGAEDSETERGKYKGQGYYGNHCIHCERLVTDTHLFDTRGVGFNFKTLKALKKTKLKYHHKDVTATLYLHAEFFCPVPIDEPTLEAAQEKAQVPTRSLALPETAFKGIRVEWRHPYW